MTWNNVGGKIPNGPLLASDWNNLYENIAAHADADAGAPAHDIENGSIVTSSTDTSQVLTPDGLGGVVFTSTPIPTPSHSFSWGLVELRGDGTDETRAHDIQLKTGGKTALAVNCLGPRRIFDTDPVITGGTPPTATVGTLTGSLQIASVGSTAWTFFDMDISKISYASGTNSIVLDTTVLWDSSSAGTVTEAITADDTWRAFVEYNAGGGNQLDLQIKTDGDTIQFRCVRSGVNSDGDSVAFGLTAQTN